MKIEEGTSGKLYTFNEYELDQYVEKLTQPLRDEIEKLEELEYIFEKQLLKERGVE